MSTRDVPNVASGSASIPNRRLRVLKHFSEFLQHLRRRWPLYLPIIAVWCFAYTRLFIDPTPRLPLLFMDSFRTSEDTLAALASREIPAPQLTVHMPGPGKPTMKVGRRLADGSIEVREVEIEEAPHGA